MAFTYDPSTDPGRVRLLCGDTESDHQQFSDAEIATFLALNDDDVRYAAAQALDRMAASEAFIQKKIKLLDLTTDGPAVATALRAQAAELRRQADEAGDAFDWAEMVTNSFTYRERLAATWLRGA